MLSTLQEHLLPGPIPKMVGKYYTRHLPQEKVKLVSLGTIKGFKISGTKKPS